MNEETMTPGTTGMIVNSGMKADLISASNWAKFLCIVGCIGMALLVIVGIMMFVVGSNFGIKSVCKINLTAYSSHSTEIKTVQRF